MLKNVFANTFASWTASLLLAFSIAHTHAESEPPQGVGKEEQNQMSFVTGIGGFFFRAKDPDALESWYHDNLGINLSPKSYDDAVWRQESGATVFRPFNDDTDYFGDPQKQFMLNFRVRDLTEVVEHLRKNGNEVEVDSETYPNGRFARTQDPEGNPIQLWEPGGVASE